MSKTRPLTVLEEHRWVTPFFASKNPVHVLRFLVPLALALFIAGYQPEWTSVVAKIAIGVVYWSFYEYWIHRTYYHWSPKHPGLRRWVESFHIHHHRDMTDLTVLNAGPVLAVALTLLLGTPVALIAGWKTAAMVLFGTTLGYYAYEWVHYSLHLRTYESGWLARMQRFHLHHHKRDWGVAFGVTNPFWDKIFGTDLQEPGRRHND